MGKSFLNKTIKQIEKLRQQDEVNKNYRNADYERWQQLDFVVGIEIRLSNNHTLNGKPFTDICDELQGKYPKNFKFTGWHPQCRCHAVTILKTLEELAKDNERILNGEKTGPDSVNLVEDVPDNFIRYVNKHPECKSETWYLDNIELFNN